MKTLKFKLLAVWLFIGFWTAWLLHLIIPRSAFRAPRFTALANANTFPGLLANKHAGGRITLQAGTNLVVPVAQRNLCYAYDTANADQYHAQLCIQTTSPLGLSPDSPSGTLVGAAEEVAIDLFGVTPGTLIGIAGGVITHGHQVVAGAAGQLFDLTLVANGNWWVVGNAVNDAAGANSEVEIIHDVPHQVTVTNGAVSAFLQ